MNTIVHIISDDKFYKGTADVFNAVPNINNIYLIMVPKGYSFKFILDVSCLTIVNSKKEFYAHLKQKGVVAVYFHSMAPDRFSIVKHVPRRIKIIWWCWGMDIYSPYHVQKPLINIDLYKPLTLQYIKSGEKKKSRLKEFIKSLFAPFYGYYRSTIIKRVDYCKTVLPIEFHYLKKNKFFKAEYFDYSEYKPFDCVHHNSVENLIIGNSATTTNNHLDVIERLCQTNTKVFHKIVFPINYGDMRYATYLKSKVSFRNACFLDSVLPYNEYSQLYSSFTHAIFGHIRQQAIGNVILAIRNSCKVFLYKDSIAYKQFKEEWGFIIYTIDDDLNDNNLQTALTEEEEKYNYEKYIHVFGSKPTLEEELKRKEMV